MSEASDRFEGGCLCGAVRFVATGQPKGVAWCPCESCRKHSGAPVSVFVAYERTAYTVTKGEIAKFESTPGKTERGFCSRCGSTLTCETVGLPTLTDFHVGAFDDAELFRPAMSAIVTVSPASPLDLARRASRMPASRCQLFVSFSITASSGAVFFFSRRRRHTR